MWECSYSREPVDFRLLFLKMLKKIWLVPVAIAGGIFVVAGFYFLYKTVLTGRTYQVENIYYIDFAEDASGKQYDWVNQYTWCTLADMDVFIDGVYEELGGTVSRADLCAYSDCTVESDGRYLYLRCTTPSPELSMKVAVAYEKTLFGFCEAHKEFNSITCEHSGEALENSNIRLKEMSVLGACIGLLVLFVVLFFIECTDTSVYVPATLEKRYHIPTLGALCMSEFEINFKHFFEAKERIALVRVDQNYKGEKLPTYVKVETFSNILEDNKALDELKKCDGVLIAVSAGGHNGKKFERVLEELTRLGIAVTATMLAGADEKLIKRYYGK